MKLFSTKEIKARLSCQDYLRSRGIEVKDGRCVAGWRGGSHLSVSIDGDQWYDHVEKQGGSVVELCARIECDNIGAWRRASEILGERLGLNPVCTLKSAKRTRAEMLIESGYAQTNVYDYRDESGKVVYQVVRFHKPPEQCKENEKPKEFVQRTPDHECLGKDTPKLLYNLPSVIKSQEVFVVEGEKDADTLTAFGMCATTNSGGATHFDPSLVRYFAGKDVVILPDNDEPGKRHGTLLVSLIHPVAKSLRMLTLSAAPKGDVTDWVENEGGSMQRLRELVNAADPAVPDCSPEVAAAKEANRTPFSNYIEEWQEKKLENGNKKSVRVLHPVPIGALIEDLKVRFLGFPRRLGDVLFDYTRGANRQIVKIHNKDALFGWVQGTSEQPVMWASGEGYVSKPELFERLGQCVMRYDAISSTPFYPPRADVFFTHDRLPSPDPTHSSFWTLVDRFCLATPADKTLFAAWLMTPMFFMPEAPKPMYLVDTVDAQGSGKSTVAKMCAYLYDGQASVVDVMQLDQKSSDVKKRLLSPTGRSVRIILFDNLTATLKSRQLAELVTIDKISERAAFGRDEESRVNDLSFVATMNGAHVDTDMAVRCYMLRVKKPGTYDPDWELDTKRLIDETRMQIYADIIDMMASAPKRTRDDSRFAKYDRIVLSAACRTDEDFKRVAALISEQRIAANDDTDVMAEFTELIEQTVARNERIDIVGPLFFLARDVDALLANAKGALANMTARKIASLIRQTDGHPFDKKFNKIAPNAQRIPRLTGVLYNPYGAQFVKDGKMMYQVVRRDDTGAFDKYGDPIGRRVGESVDALDDDGLPVDPPF